jgi:hypothetical protein
VVHPGLHNIRAELSDLVNYPKGHRQPPEGRGAIKLHNTDAILQEDFLAIRGGRDTDDHMAGRIFLRGDKTTQG